MAEITYCCPTACPRYIPEPYHIPGYSGHQPTFKTRNGKSFGMASREIIEDPCVSQAPISVLAAPMVKCPPKDACCKNPVGCGDLGCEDPCPCPPEPCKPKKKCCDPPNLPPCVDYTDPRACHLNRGPYACPCRPEPNTDIYRCCEPMSATYTGHVPGFTFHSTGRTNGVATFGTKQYMQNCFYMNTFTR